MSVHRVPRDGEPFRGHRGRIARAERSAPRCGANPNQRVLQRADGPAGGGGSTVEAAVAAREIWRGLRAADHAAVARLLAGLSAQGVLRAEAAFDAAIAPTAGGSLRVLLAREPVDPERARALRSLAAARWELSAGEV